MSLTNVFDVTVVNGESGIWLNSERLDEGMAYAAENGIDEVMVNPFRGYRAPDLNFIRKYPDIQKLSVQHPLRQEFDLSPLYGLAGLRTLHIGGAAKLDVGRFQLLERLSADWHPSMNLRGAQSLVRLSLGKYVSQSKDLSLFPRLPKLKQLSLILGNLQSVAGIERLGTLEDLTLSHLSSLRSIEPVTRLHLKRLEIDTCRKVGDFESLVLSAKLKRLIICNSGKLRSIGFIEGIRPLEYFHFYGTWVEDGDLSPLLRLKGAGFDNKRHYSHREEEVDALLGGK